MSKPMEEILREQIGALVIQNAVLTAEILRLKEELTNAAKVPSD